MNGQETLDLEPLDKVIDEFGGKPGTLIPMLQRAQEIFGYLPPEVLKRLSEKAGIPLSQIYGVVTFYSQFYLERRGKHVLKVCDGTACHVKGTPALLSAVKSDYGLDPGETTADYSLSLEVVYCIGSCALAPVGVLDEEVVGNLKQDTLRQVVREKLTAADIPSEQ